MATCSPAPTPTLPLCCLGDIYPGKCHLTCSPLAKRSGLSGQFQLEKQSSTSVYKLGIIYKEVILDVEEGVPH